MTDMRRQGGDTRDRRWPPTCWAEYLDRLAPVLAKDQSG